MKGLHELMEGLHHVAIKVLAHAVLGASQRVQL